MTTVVSADVGIPLSVERRGRIVWTAIQKPPATMRVVAERPNLIEDSSAGLRATATSKVR